MSTNNKPAGKKNTIHIIVVVAVWVTISVVGFWLVPRIIDSVMLVFASFFGGSNQMFGREYWGGTFIRSFAAVILGILLISTVIGSAEYYFKNFGKPGSWSVFARIISAEITLIILTSML
jgi:hypothetical protein